MTRTLAIAVACLSLSLLAGCKDKITQENFDRISKGMTIEQVEGVLGKGEEQTAGGMSISGAGIASSGVGSSQITYVWKGKDMTITVVTDKGKVVQVYKQE